LRIFLLLVFSFTLAAASGCGERTATFSGPTVKEFTGKLVHDNKPVTFSEDEKVTLKLFHEKGESFGIPIQSDGSFKIGWMPIGKYSVTLLREKHQSGTKKGGGAPNQQSIPGGFEIKDNQTEYTIELGKSFKP
jgi:hypothetical protein